MAPTGSYSVKDAFQGSTVLITGATGYIGGLVLEQLLRVGKVKKAYLVMRPKRGESQQQRIKTLLQGPVFRLHHKSGAFEKLLGQLEIIPGDLAQPNCGISAEDQSRLLPEVNFVIHAAASIQFDNHIHTDLTLSYVATQAIADLATKMPNLRCFMYVSTAYSNSHLPRGTQVQERLYPLHDSQGRQADHAAIAKKILETPKEQAQRLAEQIMAYYNFNHTPYGFCKNLTEQLVGSYHMKPFPVCINRPVSVGAVAKQPCPGYVGNTSGGTGVILSIACGLGTFQGRSPNIPYTVVPGDVASSVIVASIAATLAGHGNQTQPCITHACTSVSYPLPYADFIETVCDYFREDPPSLDQFGDGQYNVRWLKSQDEYEQMWQQGTARVQQLAEALQREGRPKSAARAQTAWKVWRTWSDGQRETRLRFEDTFVQDVLATKLAPGEREKVLVSFKPEYSGMQWHEYIELYCAGAKLLYLHEKPRLPVALDSLVQSSL